MSEIKKEGWQDVGITDEISISRKKMDESPIEGVFGKGVINAAPKTILAILLDVERRSDWDDIVNSTRVVENVSVQTRIIHSKYNSGWLFSPRDFVYLEYWEKLFDDNYVISYSDVKHSDVPETPDAVRGNLHIGGFLIKGLQQNPPLSEVIFMAHMQQKGSIPETVENFLAARLPFVIEKLRKVVPKNLNPSTKKKPEIINDDFNGFNFGNPIPPEKPLSKSNSTNQNTKNVPELPFHFHTTRKSTNQLKETLFQLIICVCSSLLVCPKGEIVP